MSTGTYNRLNVHIGASNVVVVKRASRKMLKPAVRFNRECRAARHAFFRDMIKCHRAARKLARAFAL